jgi:hypothetical protein
MELSEAQIKDFIGCWKRDFGEELAPDMARAEAMRLLDFFATLADVFASSQAAVTEAEDGAPTTK